MSRATFAVSLSILLLLEVPASAQSLAQGKARFDAADYPAAATSFLSTAASGSASERAEAAAFALRSFSQAGDHAKVSAEFARCVEIAAGTNFEAECYLEYGKSLQNNANDTTGALEQYAAILKRWPDNVFAASGALYQRATIELNSQRSPFSSHATCEEMLSKYPGSPFADNALLLQVKSGVGMEDLPAMERARDRLAEMKADPFTRQKAQFEFGEYHVKVSGKREKAVHEYYRTFTEFPADSSAAGIAKIRTADLVIQGDFRKSLDLYRSVLSDHPKLPKNQRDWALCQVGIYEFQVQNPEGARVAFEDLLKQSPSAKLTATAKRYLNGMRNPDSADALMIHYDRGIRFRQTGMGLDETFNEMQEVLQKGKSAEVASFVSDAKQDKEERAQMLYRQCFAYFFGGRGKEAFELAGKILDEQKPTGVTRNECLYMRAFLLGRLGEWPQAAELWRELLEGGLNKNLLPQVYLEYSRAQDFSGDRLGAVLTLEELLARFPARKESETAAQLIDCFLLRDPSLKAPIESEQPRIAEKWKRRPPSGPVELATEVVPYPNEIGGAE